MRIFLLFFFYFFIQVSFCQDTYYKSSIITLSDDTIKGFISNVYDAKAIKFKKKKDDKPTVYSPQLLRGFISDGNVFETKIVNIYNSFYNKQKGIKNGGVLKSKISKKIFTGINVGVVALQYDNVIDAAAVNQSLAFKIYGLYPLSGANRNVLDLCFKQRNLQY